MKLPAFEVQRPGRGVTRGASSAHAPRRHDLDGHKYRLIHGFGHLESLHGSSTNAALFFLDSALWISKYSRPISNTGWGSEFWKVGDFVPMSQRRTDCVSRQQHVAERARHRPA